MVKKSEFEKGIPVADYEEVIAEYFDKDAIREPDTRRFRFNYNGARFYATLYNGEVVLCPSVTSIIGKMGPLSDGLRVWMKNKTEEEQKKILDETANYGTYFHSQTKRILLGETVSFDLKVIESDILEFYYLNDMRIENIDFAALLSAKFREDAFGLIKWAQDYKVKPVALEYPIVGEKDGLLFAGSIDFVGYVNGELSLVDFKTGRNGFYLSHPPQLEAYRHAWNQTHPDLPVKNIYNWGCKNYRIPLGKTVTPYVFKDQSESPERTFFWSYLTQYYALGYAEVKSKTVFRPIGISVKTDLEKEELFEEYNPGESLAEILAEDKSILSDHPADDKEEDLFLEKQDIE